MDKDNKIHREFTLTDHVLFILRFLLFACVHSIFAATRVKSFIQRLMRHRIRFYRLCYNLVSLLMFGWVMAADRHSDVLYYIPGVWSLIMYLLQALAAAMLLLCVKQTGAGDFIGLKQLRNGLVQQNRLVTGGFYAMVRHPLYLFATIFLAMNPVMTVQWLLLTLLSITYFTLGALLEENRMSREFGEEYRRYRQSVPFLLPSFATKQRSG